MEINLKKWFFILAVLVGLGVYINTHYTFRDVLAFARKHPNPSMSPKLEYWAGMVCCLKGRNPEAIEAFQQLLTDYPTTQYTPKALINLGSMYAEGSQWENSRTYYQKYIDDYPNGPDITVARNAYENIKFK
ncbi:MAG: tetratricopeptide repeat protein [Elusimicrobia bacterium]|nr:tetratricopeptide repeat protein [Elusimicrobiota bacterium]